jgi:hypothetical protein
MGRIPPCPEPSILSIFWLIARACQFASRIQAAGEPLSRRRSHLNETIRPGRASPEPRAAGPAAHHLRPEVVPPRARGPPADRGRGAAHPRHRIVGRPPDRPGDQTARGGRRRGQDRGVPRRMGGAPAGGPECGPACSSGEGRGVRLTRPAPSLATITGAQPPSAGPSFLEAIDSRRWALRFGVFDGRAHRPLFVCLNGHDLVFSQETMTAAPVPRPGRVRLRCGTNATGRRSRPRRRRRGRRGRGTTVRGPRRCRRSPARCFRATPSPRRMPRRRGK